MEHHHGLRARILGAIILVALAVIFLPILLNHRPENTTPISQMTKRPPAPNMEFSKITVPAASSSEDVSPGAESSSATPNKMNTAPVAWALQVGSFSQEANARNLAIQLQKLSFPAYINNSGDAKKPVYRVYVGPYTEQQQAEDVAKKLADRSKLTGKVVEYNPLQP